MLTYDSRKRGAAGGRGKIWWDTQVATAVPEHSHVAMKWTCTVPGSMVFWGVIVSYDTPKPRSGGA